MTAIAIMWFALACTNAAYKLASAWWSLHRLAASEARPRWSRGDMVGTALLAIWITSRITAI